jgi:ribosomal subunit interface protein
MKIMISGKHLDIGESLKTHVEESLKKVVARDLGDVLESQVVLSKDTFKFACDISVHVSRNFVVRTHAEDDDPYRSYDLALEKMENRTLKYKSRLRDNRRQSSTPEMFTPAQQYVINVEEDKGGDTPLVIAEMKSEIPTLSVSEAVMHLDLSDSPVVMFKNPQNGNFNVIYRRTDGHVGWIDPTISAKK